MCGTGSSCCKRLRQLSLHMLNRRQRTLSRPAVRTVAGSAFWSPLLDLQQQIRKKIARHPHSKIQTPGFLYRRVFAILFFKWVLKWVRVISASYHIPSLSAEPREIGTSCSLFLCCSLFCKLFPKEFRLYCNSSISILLMTCR